MSGLSESSDEFPGSFAVLVTTRVSGKVGDLRYFCRKYEEALALGLGFLPFIVWLRRGRFLSILHLFASAEALETFLKCPAIQSVATHSLVDQSVVVEQFDVVCFGAPHVERARREAVRTALQPIPDRSAVTASSAAVQSPYAPEHPSNSYMAAAGTGLASDPA